MINYIEGLKRVSGGGDIWHAQKVIEEYYSTTSYEVPKTIEGVSKHAEVMLNRFNDDVKSLQLKTTEKINRHYTEYYERNYKKLDELWDASYCIEWTKNYQKNKK